MKPLLPILLLILGVLSRLQAEEYMRIRTGEFKTQHLDIAARRFRVGENANTKDLLLVGVSHVGLASYYEAIQEMLDQADVVLFEGVDGDREEFRTLYKNRGASENSNLQAKLAQALKLEFQLYHIRYDREHFHNSDVTTAQLRKLFNEQEDVPGAELDEEDMEELYRQMQAVSLGGQIAAATLQQLEANPRWGRALRWCMVMLLGNLKGDLADYAGVPPNMRQMMRVLIQERNKVVMHDVAEYLDTLKPGQTLAVFYGAAHMADFEERFVDELNAKTVKTDWLTAFSGNLRTSGLNVLERGMVKAFMQQQLLVLRLMAPQTESP